MIARSLRTLRSAAATAHRAARTMRDRALHPLRHRRARHQVARLPRPCRVLVMCHGNICRSPYLEAKLRALMPDIAICSAGMTGPGRGVPADGLAVAARRGLDLRSHRSQLVTARLTTESDLVIVMDEAQRRYLTTALGVPAARIVVAGDLDPVFDGSRAIRDPWQQPAQVFEASYARLDRCASVLAQSLRVVA